MKYDKSVRMKIVKFAANSGPIKPGVFWARYIKGENDNDAYKAAQEFIACPSTYTTSDNWKPLSSLSGYVVVPDLDPRVNELGEIHP